MSARIYNLMRVKNFHLVYEYQSGFRWVAEPVVGDSVVPVVVMETPRTEKHAAATHELGIKDHPEMPGLRPVFRGDCESEEEGGSFCCKFVNENDEVVETWYPDGRVEVRDAVEKILEKHR